MSAAIIGGFLAFLFGLIGAARWSEVRREKKRKTRKQECDHRGVMVMNSSPRSDWKELYCPKCDLHTWDHVSYDVLEEEYGWP